jgi:hypothetical protein
METSSIFCKYMYLFAVGSIVTFIKYIMYLNCSTDELSFEKYMLVRCFDDKNNVYFNLLYYLSNYLMGQLYVKMFGNLYIKYKNRVIEGMNVTLANETTACSICLSDILAGYKLIQLPCSHVYHQSCLKKWLLHRSICPVCKADVNNGMAGIVINN